MSELAKVVQKIVEQITPGVAMVLSSKKGGSLEVHIGSFGEVDVNVSNLQL